MIMRLQRIILITIIFLATTLVTTQGATSSAARKSTVTSVSKSKKHSTKKHKSKKRSKKKKNNNKKKTSSEAIKKDENVSKQSQTPPVYEVVPEDESEDTFGEDIDIDFDVPSDELYGFSWTSEFLNPYKIKINDLPDSTWIDCRGFVFPVVKSTAANNHVTSGFGARRRRYHYGTDIGLKVGDSVVSSFAGTVRIVEYEARGYGHYIVIRHNNGLETLYAHLSKPLVKVNQEVTAGQLIGLGGSTGRSTGPHLHFEFRFLGNAFNTGKIIDYSTERCFADSYCITKNETFRHKADVERFNQMKYHRVRQGETLSYIAKRYGTTVKRICRLNHISRTTVIRPGRSIRYR
ncbi:MAG: peptidoglycan DD-metalloendopeptidase family protein [Bacteroidota bacterium]|jgi:peptidase, M23/M37 family